LKSDVLDQKCNNCHGKPTKEGITPLDTYATMLSVKNLIQPMIFGIDGNREPVPEEGLMPPPKDSAPLTEDEKARFLLWYADGLRNEYGELPSNAEAGPAPAPSPEPIPTSSPSSIPSQPGATL
jgi:hypothetical protein